LQYSFYVIHKY